MSLFARFKRAARQAIAACGGIEAARAGIGKGSVVGEWNARDNRRLPSIADAHALDEIALIETGRAPLLEVRAAELGFAIIRLPEFAGSCEAIALEVARCASEFGDVARSVVDALADGRIERAERDAIAREIDEAQAALVRLRALALAEAASFKAERD